MAVYCSVTLTGDPWLIGQMRYYQLTMWNNKSNAYSADPQKFGNILVRPCTGVSPNIWRAKKSSNSVLGRYSVSHIHPDENFTYIFSHFCHQLLLKNSHSWLSPRPNSTSRWTLLSSTLTPAILISVGNLIPRGPARCFQPILPGIYYHIYHRRG